MKAAPSNDTEYARTRGQELGLDVRAVYERGPLSGWLIHGYWHGAPVAINLRREGGLSVAFHSGNTPPDSACSHPDGQHHVHPRSDSNDNVATEWHEILDTQFAGLDVALTLGAAALDQYGTDVVARYSGTLLPNETAPGDN